MNLGRLLACGLVLLIIGCGAENSATENAPAERSDRTVYVDPETGRIVAPPAGAEAPTAQRRIDAGKQALQVLEGEGDRQVLIHRPESWSELRATTSTDGSLNIRHREE